MFSEIQEVFYFPIKRTKEVNTVGATISFDSGKVPDWSVRLYPAAFMHVLFVHLLALRNLLRPIFAFIQAWSLQSLQSRVEK